MRYIYVLLSLGLVLLSQGISANERPIVNPPLDIRQPNWIGSQREGSCVYATMVTLLRWQGRYQAADHIRRTCGNGASLKNISDALEKRNIRFAYVKDGDVSFLEWACKTRRGAGVVVHNRKHFVALVHLDNKWACILDNNSVNKFIWKSRESFLKDWRESGGWAVVVVYSPAAPLPRGI